MCPRNLGRLCAWLLLAAVVTPTAGDAQVGRTEIEAVTFDGNASFPDDSLARAVVSRETECRALVLSPFCLAGANFAVQRFYLRDDQVQLDGLRLVQWYWLRGFREADVEPMAVDTVEGRARVSFLVEEGEPILAASIDVLGAASFEADGLLEDLPLQVGDRLSLLALDATTDTLERRLMNRGYAHAFALHSNLKPADDPYRAQVSFDVDPGPLAQYGAITVEGNLNVSESTILNTTQIYPGRVYRRSQLLDAQARLWGLDIIRSARVEADSTAMARLDSIIPVRIVVQEGPGYRLRAGAGWSSSECLDIESRWAARNFLGGGRTLQLRGRLSNVLASEFHDILCPQSGSGVFGDPNWLAALDFAQPWIFSTRNSFAASVFGERQSLPDVFVREAVGLQVALTRAIGPQTPLTLSYRPELSRLDAAQVLFCTGFLVCTPDDVSILERANWLAPIGINFSRNLINNPLNPTRGYSLLLDLEHAAQWTGSNFRYDRVVTEGTWRTRVGARGVLATRLRGGWVGAGPFSKLVGAGAAVDIVHPQKRFYAGGANSVRGFAQSRLGPRVLTVDPARLLTPTTSWDACAPEQIIDLSCDASGLAEGRFVPRPTGGTRVFEANIEVRFGLGASLEGVTFTDVGQVWGATEDVSLGDLEVTPGAGVRFLSPIGPIRLDVAYRFRGGQPLSVVTSQLRSYDAEVDAELDRLVIDGAPIQFVRAPELAVLGSRVLFGETSALSLRRFQLHISIGQAF